MKANERLLTAALPFPDIPDPKILAAVVQETIFSQLLRLPESELGVLAYAKVTVSYLMIPYWWQKSAIASIGSNLALLMITLIAM